MFEWHKRFVLAPRQMVGYGYTWIYPVRFNKVLVRPVHTGLTLNGIPPRLACITDSTFIDESSGLGFMRTCLIVVFPLKCACIPYLPHVCFILSAIPFVYGMTTCPTVVLFTCLLMVGQLLWLLLMAFPLLLLLVLLLFVELLQLVSSWLLFKTFCCTL